MPQCPFPVPCYPAEARVCARLQKAHDGPPAVARERSSALQNETVIQPSGRADTAAWRGQDLPQAFHHRELEKEKRGLLVQVPRWEMTRCSPAPGGEWVWREENVEKTEVAPDAVCWVMIVKVKSMAPTIRVGSFLTYF